MRIITTDCSCEHWNKIGVKTHEMPYSSFGGIHYFKNEMDAVRKWIELSSNVEVPMGHHTPVAYHWAVHLNGRHIVNILWKELDVVET